MPAALAPDSYSVVLSAPDPGAWEEGGALWLEKALQKGEVEKAGSRL